MIGELGDHRSVGRDRGALHDARRRGRDRALRPRSMCDSYKQTVFNFERHRQIEHYGRITSQHGAEPPA